MSFTLIDMDHLLNRGYQKEHTSPMDFNEKATCLYFSLNAMCRYRRYCHKAGR
jgi:hypothetical protein